MSRPNEVAKSELLQSISVPLADIADIRSGFTFRGKVEELSGDRLAACQGRGVRMLQIKDLRLQSQHSFSWQVNEQALPFIEWQGRDKALLQPGDVLLPARGDFTQAFIYQGQQATSVTPSSTLPTAQSSEAAPVVASGQILILKAKPSGAKSATISPEFLCWSLNQPVVQSALRQQSTGSAIAMLKAANVGQVSIPLPTPEVQQKILTLNQLWQREQQLTQDLLQNRETMLKGMFQQLLKGTH